MCVFCFLFLIPLFQVNAFVFAFKWKGSKEPCSCSPAGEPRGWQRAAAAWLALWGNAFPHWGFPRSDPTSGTAAAHGSNTTKNSVAALTRKETRLKLQSFTEPH